MYYYRAVDQNGETVDSYLSRNRKGKAAKTFFRKAFKSADEPVAITLDACAANYRSLAELKARGELYERVRVRSANNIVEQDHRRIKRRVEPM
jgi:transposase-like protein